MVKNLPAESIFLPGKFYGQRSLMGYSPWGHKESDTTEHAHTHACACTYTHTQTHTHTHTHNLCKFPDATAFEFITATCVSI